VHSIESGTLLMLAFITAVNYISKPSVNVLFSLKSCIKHFVAFTLYMDILYNSSYCLFEQLERSYTSCLSVRLFNSLQCRRPMLPTRMGKHVM